MARKRRLLHILVRALGPPLLRLLGSTWSVKVLPEGVDDERDRRGEKAIFSFWHGRMVIPAFTHRFRNIAILISRHGDGEFIASVVGRLGFVPIRGSTTRGGVAGLVGLLRSARGGLHLAFTPDGPRGPRYKVQRGVVYAASRTGMPIVPCAVEAHPAWVLGSWDEFTIPKPFARTVILQGEPIPIPPGVEGEKMARFCLEVEERTNLLTEQARRIVRET